jgi:Domain of unknown function (DUF4386)
MDDRRADVNSAKKTARIGGALYLLSAAAAGVPLLYIPNTLIVPRDAAVTANNILASETSFRACIVRELIGATVFIFMVRALYRLLNGVNWSDASLMVTLVLRSVPITLPNALNEIAALALTHGALPSCLCSISRSVTPRPYTHLSPQREIVELPCRHCFQRADIAFNLLCDLIFGDFQVIVRLEIHPEGRTTVEVARETQGCVSSNCAFLVDDIGDPRHRDAQVHSNSVHA